MRGLKASAIACVLALSGCTATTTFNSVQNDVKITVDKYPEAAISSTEQHKYPTTSFGQYEFKAHKEGTEPMYGLLPLKFNGGYLAADIIFFAPAAFFNLREVFPFYEFDIEQQVLRYKKEESDAWTEYKPSRVEIERAKAFFGESE